MKIRNYLILTFLGIALLIFVFAHISFSSAQESLEKSISAELETLAVLTMYEIDRDIDGQIESFQLFVTDHSVTKFLSNSNQEFEKLDDLENYITEKDNEWVNVPLQEITPFMQNILANELSEKLRLKQEFLSNKYGYKVFGELFITNAYGANIAQTGKTIDYKQNDETWWTEAKENGFFVGAVEYDESAGIFSKDLVIRIEQDGKFLGVMKIVYNIKEISNIIDHVGIDLDKHAKMEIKLLNKEGQIIYSTVDFTIFENAPQDELSQIISQSGSFFITKGSVEEFRAFAVSAEHNGHPDLDLVLLFELETEEILGPIIQQVFLR